jgi:hypothetical protein
MKWTNRMLGDESRYPTQEDLLDYLPAVESLSETDEMGRRKAGVNEAETGNKLWSEAVGLNEKDLPFRDLLYPHEPTHSRNLRDYVPDSHALPDHTPDEDLYRDDQDPPPTHTASQSTSSNAALQAAMFGTKQQQPPAYSDSYEGSDSDDGESWEE